MGSVSYCTHALIITHSNKKIYKVKVPSSSLSNLTLLAGTARPLIIIVLDFSWCWTVGRKILVNGQPLIRPRRYWRR